MVRKGRRETAPAPGSPKSLAATLAEALPCPGEPQPSAPGGVPRMPRFLLADCRVTMETTRSKTMRVGLLGRKVGMTQVYQTDGTSVPVTVLECGPCTVLSVRTEQRDGYHAVQLGFDDKKRKTATQTERGHAKHVN